MHIDWWVLVLPLAVFACFLLIFLVWWRWAGKRVDKVIGTADKAIDKFIETKDKSDKKSPLDIAKERYAKGEISKQELEEIKKDLT